MLAYTPRREGRSLWLDIRGLRYHAMAWGDAAAGGAEGPLHAATIERPLRATAPDRPLRVLVHGWMDVGASFQFVVDALDPAVPVVAPDWRGFGRSAAPAGTDAYWFPDYLGDLDALLETLSPDAPVDLVGHSMGGNVAMAYAGVRPQRVRRLVNLEGFGLPDMPADDAPARLSRWLDELKTPQRLRDYTSLDEVAARLRQTNPRLDAAFAAWLAAHWAAPQPDGRWALRADPAHKRINPVPYRAAEAVALWRMIEAPVLWVEGAESRAPAGWAERYPRSVFDERLAQVRRVERHVIAGAAHMLHHDQPQALAERIEAFLDR